MSESETWRVVLVGGDVQEVLVEGIGTQYRATLSDGARAWGMTPLAAIAAVVIAPVRETLAPGVSSRAQLLAERYEASARCADALADYAAVSEYLGGIVRAWERASDDDRRMADTFVSGLRREIEEARDSGRGAWWEVCRGGDPAPLRTNLAAVTAQRDRAVESVARLRRDVEHEMVRRDIAEAERDEAQVQRDEAREALATARREGAEDMRAAAVRLLDACGSPRVKLTIDDAVYAVNFAAAGLTVDERRKVTS